MENKHGIANKQAEIRKGKLKDERANWKLKGQTESWKDKLWKRKRIFGQM
jgi:hypothetical protein